MNSETNSQNGINLRFKKKLEVLKDILPPLGKFEVEKNSKLKLLKSN